MPLATINSTPYSNKITLENFRCNSCNKNNNATTISKQKVDRLKNSNLLTQYNEIPSSLPIVSFSNTKPAGTNIIQIPYTLVQPVGIKI